MKCKKGTRVKHYKLKKKYILRYIYHNTNTQDNEDSICTHICVFPRGATCVRCAHQIPVTSSGLYVKNMQKYGKHEYNIAESRAEYLADSSHPISADMMSKLRAIGSGSPMLSDVATKRPLKYSVLHVRLGR